MLVPIISGIYTDDAPDVRSRLPRNLIPVPKASGATNGYLRPGDGLVSVMTGPGTDRGGYIWEGSHYRVMGTKLVSVGTSEAFVLGDVGSGGPVTWAHSFDRLAITSGGRLYLWDSTALLQVTDPDLGTALCVVWVDGRFMTTDGDNIVVTELGNDFAVDPLKYGSSEVDPDPIVRLLKLRNEVHALNRYSVEVFANNPGGTGFPFERIPSAQVPRGCVGTNAACVFGETLAMVGGAADEAVAVWLVANGTSAKVSTREIDTILSEYTDAELAAIEVEKRFEKGHDFLYLHLPDETLVFDAAASKETGIPVWFTLDSGPVGRSVYLARHFATRNGITYCGNTVNATIGKLDNTVSTHYGANVQHEFGTAILWNEGNAAILHEMELLALPGRYLIGAAPVVWASYSNDGVTYSQERAVSAGSIGNREKRIGWRSCGTIENWRVQRFRWTSDCHLSVMGLSIQVEPLKTRPA